MGDILFIGGDRRMICAAELISQSGGVCAVGLGGDFPEPENQSGGYERIVLPVPFSRDGENITAPLSERPLPLELLTDYAAAGARIFSGGTSTKLETLCENHGLQLVNYMAAEELTLKNALLTAEGAVSLLISGYDGALFDSTAVITGYGRIARYLARLLQAFRCRVTIAARSPLQREAALLDGLCTLPVTLAGLAAAGADLVINTVPACILTEECFSRMRYGAVYMELATRSETPEKGWAEARGVKYIAAGGLPGKFSPRTAGEAIARAVISAEHS